MTHSHGTLQKPDAQFLAHANTINKQCHEHASEMDWNIDPNRLANFDAVLYNAHGAAKFRKSSGNSI